MSKKGATIDSIITDLYIATLNRPPRKTELAEIKEKDAFI
jgi:hypothetical protein